MLELGAGGGLPGLIAAKCGAQKVHMFLFMQTECAVLQPPTSLWACRSSSRIIQTRRSSTIWSSTSSRTSSSRGVAQYVSWDTSGANPSIHSSVRYFQIPQIQTPARIHFST